MKIIIFITFGAIAAYLIWCWIIKKCTGCTTEEAARKIQCFINGEEPYKVGTDPWLVNYLWDIIHGIIGEERFEELRKLVVLVQLVFTGFKEGIPYIAFTVICPEYLRPRLEAALVAALSQILQRHGLPGKVIAEWTQNEQLKLPVIMLLYAETSQQRIIVDRYLGGKVEKILSGYQEVYDDDEEIRE